MAETKNAILKDRVFALGSTSEDFSKLKVLGKTRHGLCLRNSYSEHCSVSRSQQALPQSSLPEHMDQVVQNTNRMASSDDFAGLLQDL